MTADRPAVPTPAADADADLRKQFENVLRRAYRETAGIPEGAFHPSKYFYAQADALLPLVRAEVDRAVAARLANVWDEGYVVGARLWSSHSERTPNPYRPTARAAGAEEGNS